MGHFFLLRLSFVFRSPIHTDCFFDLSILSRILLPSCIALAFSSTVHSSTLLQSSCSAFTHETRNPTASNIRSCSCSSFTLKFNHVASHPVLPNSRRCASHPPLANPTMTMSPRSCLARARTLVASLKRTETKEKNSSAMYN